MADMVGSALIRRHIGRRFAALRVRAGLTQEQAADRLQRGRATIGRIEDGDPRVRFREIDVRAMLEIFGASRHDAQVLLALTAETRNGPRKGWWHDYTETALPDWFGLYVSLEDSAELIRQYEPELVPGLLQTRAYAETVTRVPRDLITDEQVQRRVDLRMKRQALLSRPRAPHLRVLLGEAALRRLTVPGGDLGADQLRHLLAVTRRGNVSIRVLPFAAGASGVTASAFALLDFPRDPRSGEVLEPPLAYVDTLTGAMYLNKVDEVAAYNAAWQHLAALTLDEAASEAMITAALERI